MEFFCKGYNAVNCTNIILLHILFSTFRISDAGGKMQFSKIKSGAVGKADFKTQVCVMLSALSVRQHIAYTRVVSDAQSITFLLRSPKVAVLWFLQHQHRFLTVKAEYLSLQNIVTILQNTVTYCVVLTNLFNIFSRVRSLIPVRYATYCCCGSSCCCCCCCCFY